jgi:putative transcriptional regulator
LRPEYFTIDNSVAHRKHNIVRGNENSPVGESGLYNRIAVLRAERDISRQELANALGVNYQTIGFLERGDYGPSLKLALELAAYFGLPVEAIFSTQPFRPLSEQVYGTVTTKQALSSNSATEKNIP